jgi:hypothetical protein
MLSDFHVRISDANWPDLQIIITREGKPPVTFSGSYDTFATKFEPAVTNVLKEEVGKLIDRRTKTWR